VSSLFGHDHRARKTPVFVLTGFLGSGKTTLLNRLLREAALADTAVIVNELGEVAIDHLLVQPLAGEVAVLRSGCVCCAMRSDFESTLRELLARRDEGSVPAFGRVVVETTGLADPAPLMQTVEANPLVNHFCALAAVVTTVDVVNAGRQLAAQWEARKQVALADTLLLTKGDLRERFDDLNERLDAINPTAWRLRGDRLADPAVVLEPRLPAAALDRAVGVLAGRPIAPLHGEVHSFVLRAALPLDWPRLQRWLAELREQQGERLLRLKGVASIAGEAAPIVLHGVHHLFHPPVAATGLAWPEGATALVLIGRGLPAAELRAGFDRCLAG
jgi:G3E family GTPase